MNFEYSETSMPPITPIEGPPTWRSFCFRWRKPLVVAGLVLVLLVGLGIKSLVTPKASTAQGKNGIQPWDGKRTSQTTERVKLPAIPGRHDHIERDPFQSALEIKSDKGTVRHTPTPRPVPLLHLKAIALGAKPRAFINDSFVSEGELFEVTGLEEKQCRVISIEEGTVTIQVGEATEILRLVSEQDGEKTN